MTANLISARRLLGETPADWRRDRELIDAREIWRRARRAATAEMRGASFSADDRADAAAEIVGRVLTDLTGTPPSAPSFIGPRRRGLLAEHERERRAPDTIAAGADDRRATLSRCCSHARHIRRDILAERDRRADELALAPLADLLADPADLDAANVDHGATLVARIGRAIKVADALDLDATRADVMAALLADTDPRAERDRPPASPAERKAAVRGRKLIRADWPSDRLADAARALYGAPPARHGAELLLPGSFALPDAGRGVNGRELPGTRRPQDTGRIKRAPDWRTGTNAGAAPDRPTDRATADAASDRSRVRNDSGRIVKCAAKPTPDVERIESLARLGRALATAERATDQRERRRATAPTPARGVRPS